MRKRPTRSALGGERLETRDLLAALDALRFAEFMYHPAEPSAGPFTRDDFEFIELVNTSAETIDLAGVTIAEGVTFNFATSPIQTLAAGARVLVVKHVAAFESRYGAGLPIAGAFGSQLSDAGEGVQLLDGGVLAQRVAYLDDWRPVTDGDGFSLTVVDPAAPQPLWSDPANYRGSLRDGGSPGVAEAPPHAGDVVINELLAHTDVDPGDWIELHNTTDRAINIAGWYLSDNSSNLNRYRIGDDVFIPAGGYRTFTQQRDFGNPDDPGTLVPFGFSELGESAHLSSWDSNGVDAVYRESQGFRASDQEVSFGRYTTSAGEIVFVEQASSSFDAANGAPLVGPVVISEIMYNQQGAGNEHEFIELLNRSGAPVPLFDALAPANTWKFTNGVEFVFPTGVTMPPGGLIVIAAIAPEAFRAANNVPEGVPVFGPWLGSLDKGGEPLTLSYPGTPEPGGFVPYYRAEHVEYGDSSPWPNEPDGNGPSLVRAAVNLFGNDPANWKAGSQTGGTPGRPNNEATLPGDTDGDGDVDVTDLNNVRNNFGAVGPGTIGDANGDGAVDIVDLNAVRNNFGATLPAPSMSPQPAATTTRESQPAHRARDLALAELMSEWNSAPRRRWTLRAAAWRMLQ